MQVDIEEFDRLIKKADCVNSPETKVESFRQALKLYKGDFLPEIYDAWTDTLRQRFREQLLKTLCWLAEYEMQEDNYFECATICENYLSIDPLSESIVRLCMRSLSRLGRMAAVKAHYDSLKKVLRHELHCAPSKKTKDLYNSLLRSCFMQ